MTESLGVRLRQRRERQQITLVAIAEQTKIKLSLLESLERDDTSQWPTGIFRRAFVRAYAHAIGLEPDVVIREFLERHPDPVETIDVVSAIAQNADATSRGPAPPTRLGYLVGSAMRSLFPGPGGSAERPVAAVEERPVAGAPPPAPSETELVAIAQLCTRLGCVERTSEMTPLLQEAAGLLDVPGLIVWVWDGQASELRPALAHGYSEKVLAQLPTVRRDTDNATAAAFRSAQPCAVKGSELTSGALVVPLMASIGCVGVLAIELQNGREQSGWVCALVTILAAQLATLVGTAQSADMAGRKLA